MTCMEQITAGAAGGGGIGLAIGSVIGIMNGRQFVAPEPLFFYLLHGMSGCKLGSTLTTLRPGTNFNTTGLGSKAVLCCIISPVRCL